MLVLLVTLVIGNWIYSNYVFSWEITSRPHFLIDEFKQIEDADAVWMSASMEFSTAPTDSIDTPFSQILGESLQENVVPIAKPAFNAKDFYHIVSQKKELFEGKKLYVSMNMRTFGMKWQSKSINKENSFNSLFYNNNPKLINRLRASLSAHVDTPDDEFQWLVQYERIKKLQPENHYYNRERWLETIKDETANEDDYWWKRENLEKFAFNMDESNRMLFYFDQLIMLCQELDIQLVCVILPEDLNRLKKVYGQELERIIHYNNAYLTRHFSSVTVINLFNLLESEYFYEDFITEHYNFEGKRKIAQSIKNELN